MHDPHALHRTYFDCSCYGEVLAVEVDPDDGLVSIAIFRNHPSKHGWRDRIRWIWHFLRTGEPFVDQVVFTPGVAADLGRHLARLLVSKPEHEH